MLTLGVLASGNGSNLQAILDYFGQNNPAVRVGVVLSDNPHAHALARARKAGVPALHIPPGRHRTFLDPEVEKRYAEALRNHGVDLVCLAGFMRVVKKGLLEAFPGRIVNIHPSLLPAFPGLKAWEQALKYGVRFSGCTVHFVERDVDAGPILLQAVVPVLPDDSPETLLNRIHAQEHVIYPLAVRLIAESRVTVCGRRVYLR